MKLFPRILLTLATIGIFASCAAADQPAKETRKDGWQSLFNGKNLDGWEVTQFGGEGDVVVENGEIHLYFGSSLTGIHYRRPTPKTNYELALEAKRVDGVDFFCALTFPVNDSFCSFVVGGWGGAVVGLSSIDGADASENETTKYMRFEQNRWYRIRVRVRPERIEAWIDDERVVDVDIRDRQIDTRIEVELSKPLGIASWETHAALRNIRLRKLPAEGAASSQ